MNRTSKAEGSVNGAESLVRTSVASGVDTCFANPGTSEMHFVAALDRVPGIRCVLARKTPPTGDIPSWNTNWPRRQAWPDRARSVRPGNPILDWTRLAAGMGVEAACAKRLEELARLLTASFKRPGPFLIELVIT